MEFNVYHNKFVIRTVKNGKVKIFGSYYAPTAEVNERFDGKRYAFGLYRSYNNYYISHYIYFWGSESSYKMGIKTEDDDLMINDKGEYEWMWWYKVG